MLITAFAFDELPRLVLACLNNALPVSSVPRHVRLMLGEVLAEDDLAPKDQPMAASALEAVSRQLSALAMARGMEAVALLRLDPMPETGWAERVGRNFSHCHSARLLPTVDNTGTSALEIGHRYG
jgi:hypothetical protein